MPVRIETGEGPFVLGVHVAHDASVAICSPKGVVFSIQEERVSRIKHHYGFPERALRTALAVTGLTARDFVAVAFPVRQPLFPEAAVTMTVELSGESTRVAAPMPREEARAFHDAVLAGLPAQWDAFRDRHPSNFSGMLQELGLLGPATPHVSVHHHRAHAASAFRLSGLERSAVLTVDGKGDKVSATIYLGQADGRLDLLRSSAARDSLGSMYQAATEALGFVPVDGEYKTMGLAAVAKGPAEPNPFTGIIGVEDGRLKSMRAWSFRDFNEHNPTQRVANPLSSVVQCEEFRALLSDMPREVLARSVQEECEQLLLELADSALRLSGQRNLATAGGVALNVKANARIRDVLRPETFFVYPDAADSGLAAGAAMEALFQLGWLNGKPIAAPPDPYAGTAYGRDEIHATVAAVAPRAGLRVRPANSEMLVEELVAGRVIGSFQGRMEMGPRALGNRSVLADPRRVEVKDRINRILKGREWFVPFAPVLLEDEARRCWSGMPDSRYMTFSVEANAYARAHLPAVVHVDGSMRPQVTSHARNPWLADLLESFRARTGLACLTNTSFNRHGLPIVESPNDALEHLTRGWVDAVAVGDLYVERDGGQT